MGNQDRTNNPDTHEKERSRETQPGQQRPGQGGMPGQSGVPNEGRVSDRTRKAGDEDDDEQGTNESGRGTGRPDEKQPKQYVSGDKDKSRS